MKIRQIPIHRMFPLDTCHPPFGSTATGNTAATHRPKSKIRTTQQRVNLLHPTQCATERPCGFLYRPKCRIDPGRREPTRTSPFPRTYGVRWNPGTSPDMAWMNLPRASECVEARTSTLIQVSTKRIYMIMNAPVTRESIVDSCLLILHDWSGFITLADTAIEKERGVIREEWRTRQDAQTRIWEQQLPKMFPEQQICTQDGSRQRST